MLPPFKLEHTLEQLVREDWGRLLASLVATFNDWQLAEDVLQDAVEQALVVWKKDGLPKSPAAWLITTARRKAIDQFRRTDTFNRLQPEIVQQLELNMPHADVDLAEVELDNAIPDKRLELVFACCHPSLDRKTQVALTLRTLGGLTTDEIAAAFLDKRQTMAQRLARAKKKIAVARIPFVIPTASELSERVNAVLSVLYLIFNEGYTASSGKHVSRGELTDEAMRLTRIVSQLLPAETEVSGLLSLMLLHDSRRFSRVDKNLNMVSLEHQNRNQWDKSKITEGIDLLKKTLAMQKIGVYQLQAAISAVHAEAASWQETDWGQINALYELLYTAQASPVVRVNQAVAMSYAVSVEAALQLLAKVAEDKSMHNYQPFFAARADLHSRDGNLIAATADFEKAIALSDNDSLRAFLEEKLRGLM